MTLIWLLLLATKIWEQRKLGEIFKFSQGLQVPIDQQFERKEENTERFIRIVDVTQDNIPQRFVYNPTGKGRVNLDDIFFVRYGAVGTIGHGFKGVIANNLFKVIPLIDINPLFWFYQFSDIRFNSRLKALSASTSMPAINFNTLRKMIISNTSIVEQNKIGTILKSLDNLLTLYERKLKLLSQVKKYFLDNLFTEKEYPNLRFKGFTDAWEQRKLGEIGTTYSGLSGKNKSDFEKGNSNFVTFLEVLNNPILKNIDLTNKVEIKENEHQNKVKRNDILFNTSSETPEEVATSTIVDVNQDNLYLNSFCFGFRPNVQFSNYYIGYYLRSNHFRNRVFCLAQGISRYNISKKSLIKLKLSLPKLEEQDKIGKIFNQVELLLTLYESKKQNLNKIKNTLLNTMFI